MAREGPGRYFVAWKTKLLLVSKDQLRLATMEETTAFEEIASDMRLVGQGRDDWAYVDVTSKAEDLEEPSQKDLTVEENRKCRIGKGRR